MNQLSDKKNLAIVSTGKYLGEGFDLPRLDTLFLCMPIAWKGTIQQYIGRLHRKYTSKEEVRVYDYIDIYIKMLERMYQKRLKGYYEVGYELKLDNKQNNSRNIMFDSYTYLETFNSDLNNSTKSILIASPFLSVKKCQEFIEKVSILDDKIKIIVITNDLTNVKDKYMR